MNTPTLVISFATVVLGGVSLTGNNKILGLSVDPMVEQKMDAKDSGVRSVGIYTLPDQEELPAGVTREP